jgi:hypothetical protein
MDKSQDLRNADFQRMMQSIQGSVPSFEDGVNFLRDLSNKVRASAQKKSFMSQDGSVNFLKQAGQLPKVIPSFDELTQEEFVALMEQKRMHFLYLRYSLCLPKRLKRFKPEDIEDMLGFLAIEPLPIEVAKDNLHALTGSTRGKLFLEKHPYFLTHYDRAFFRVLREREEAYASIK